ncbi:MAG: galactokinase [Firmicutes bacterium]|nr:galactokinase [Bacillota bacterium]
MTVTRDQVLQAFLAFSPGPVKDVRIFFAPGRVNLMGEHLDYNGGHVLPAAIDVGTWCAVRLRGDGRWRLQSRTEAAVVEATMADLRPADPARGFANYPLGVIAALDDAGLTVPGADCYFWGTVLQGAGLSSSASLEVVTGYALTQMAGISLDRIALAQIAQRAENEYVGVPCGLMDQLTVALGRRDHALLLDIQAVTAERVPVATRGEWTLVIVDSRKPHHLVTSPYRQRREECAAALAILQSHGWPIQHLAAISSADLSRALRVIGDPVLQRRVRHVVREEERTRQAADVLARGDFAAFGALMKASHESLRTDYEVTGPELDTLAEAAWSAPGCAGSRMTGAGFGGSTIAWVAREAVKEFQEWVRAQYVARFGYDPGFLVATLADGVHEVVEHREAEES